MTQTPNDRHPDIEIYIKQRSAERISQWLESLFDNIEAIGKRGHTYRYNAAYQSHNIPITVIDQAAKGFSSVWFDSAETPWAIDLDCALQAQQQLDTEVRCIASGWKEGDEPDEWWSITDQGKNKIQWQD
ncbi:MAG: hypothetical protein V7752_16280 [Halopseudomonas sp.]